MSTGVDCTVYVDGQRLADGSPGDDPTAPTVLSGLSFPWGRDNTVDQPDSSTCTFTLIDDPGGAGFMGLLRVGRRVDVTATGTIYGSPEQGTIVDPSFDDTPIGATPTNVRATNAIATVELAGDEERRALRIVPRDAGTAEQVLIAPAAFSPSPAAWDEIPTTAGGQTWTVTIDAQATTHGVITMQPVLIFDPAGNRVEPVGDPVTVNGTGGFQTLTRDIVPGVAGAWVGVRVRIFPSGQSWAQTPGSWSDYAAGGGYTDWVEERRNYIPNTNVDVTGGLGWTLAVSNAAASVSLGVGADGQPTRRYTLTSITAQGVINAYGARNQAVLPVGVLGETWLVGFRARASRAGGTVALGISPGGTSNAAGPTVYLEVGADEQMYWAPITIDLAAAAGARLSPRIGLDNRQGSIAWAAGDWLEFSDPVLTRAPWEDPGFFDGDTLPAGADPELTRVRWLGEPHASPSVLETRERVPGTDGPSWLDFSASFVDDVRILAPEEGATRTVLAFSGRITDLAAGYDDALDAPTVTVTAADFTADLENVRVGDEPWVVEPLTDRFSRVLALSGTAVSAVIDDGIGQVSLSYQDVDSQGVTGLLKDYAQSVDAVMWSATHQSTGPYLHVEDPASRLPMFELEQNEAGLVVIVTAEGLDVQRISACDVLRDPVTWEQSVSDVATRVAVTWLEQGVNDEGRPETTERTVTVIDDQLEAVYGQRGISVSTLLTSAVDATEIALRIFARASVTGWRATGITIDDPESLQQTDDHAVGLLLRLLDGTSRNGMPVMLTDLPAWSPIAPTLPVYVEGGTYTHVDGTWTLQLTVSRATGQGRSVTWQELDEAWSWADFDEAIAWEDLIGVGNQVEGGI